MPAKLALSADKPVADYFRQFPGLDAGAGSTTKGSGNAHPGGSAAGSPSGRRGDLRRRRYDVLKQFLKDKAFGILLAGYPRAYVRLQNHRRLRKPRERFQRLPRRRRTLATFPRELVTARGDQRHTLIRGSEAVNPQVSWVKYQGQSEEAVKKERSQESGVRTIMHCSRVPTCLPFGIVVFSGRLLASLVALGFSPEEAVKRMKAADGLQVRLPPPSRTFVSRFASEFDDRGRVGHSILAISESAGLKRRKVDRYSRTEYDRIPEPPPRGPQGADRITIFSGDFDANGRAHKTKFRERRDLATGLAFGHGGVCPASAYLLFYPDRNCDDVPDGDPEVLLGFGMEDAHSVANSLTWGPDGWLYGCQGSGYPAYPRHRIPTGRAAYHPRRSGLNCSVKAAATPGARFPSTGHALYSTNVGPNAMLHQVQGGYYWKSFGKHGALHNLYTFGFLDHVPYTDFRGGHVTVGGIVYQGDSLPARFRGKYIAGDLLGHAVYWHDMEPAGSTFRSQHGGDLLVANDTWFAPSDVTMGPDGAVYVADWYDQRTAHPDPDADWDRSNGRIYCIEATGTRREPLPDLAKLPSAKLIALRAPNDWYVRKARRLLATAATPQFCRRAACSGNKDDHLALSALGTVCQWRFRCRIRAQLLNSASRYSPLDGAFPRR